MREKAVSLLLPLPTYSLTFHFIMLEGKVVEVAWEFHHWE